MTIPIIFGLVGITYIITRSRLTLNIRKEMPSEPLRYMLNCAQCTGFWVGFLFYIVLVPEITGYALKCYQASAFIKDAPYMPMLLAFVYGGLVSFLSSLTVNFLELIALSKDYIIVHVGQHQQQPNQPKPIIEK